LISFLGGNLASGTGVTIGTVMSEELIQPPLDPTIRFRLRTILVATTILAVAAAIAAPYWRAQPPSVRAALLVFWSCSLAFTAMAGWLHLRRSAHLAPQAGRIVSTTWPTGRKRWLPARGLIAVTFATAMALFCVTSQSWLIARRNEQLSPSAALLYAGFNGVCYGFMLGGGVLVVARRPLYLCDGGVSGAIGFVPWKYIRHAEWVADRPGVMKLRRLDGDIYLDVPNSVRGEAEAFVRGKTRFVDEAALPPV
jgi:type II secretory pathway pseudopilin PulG